MAKSAPRPQVDASARRRLLAAARKARERAYAPYSRCPVGAAVLAADGRIHAGCNVENSSSPSGLCAEQSAVARAVEQGARRILAVAVVARARRPLAPCGRCRQVLAEFGTEMRVLMATTRGRCEETGLEALLPRPFRR